MAALIDSVKASMRSFQLNVALRDIWEVIGASNRYIVTREPWKIAKDDSKRAELETALYIAADTLRVVAELLRPFMPETGDRMLRMLGIEPAPTSWASLAPGVVDAGNPARRDQRAFSAHRVLSGGNQTNGCRYQRSAGRASPSPEQSRAGCSGSSPLRRPRSRTAGSRLTTS